MHESYDGHQGRGKAQVLNLGLPASTQGRPADPPEDRQDVGIAWDRAPEVGICPV